MEIIIVILAAFILITPIFGYLDIFLSIDKLKKPINSNSRGQLNSLKFRMFFSIYSFFFFIVGILGILTDISSNESQKRYGDGTVIDFYTPIEHDAIPTIITLFLFAFLAYFILNLYSKKIAPIIYVTCSSLLLANIIFTIFYVIQIWACSNSLSSITLCYGLINLSFLYIAVLISSLSDFIEKVKLSNKEYTNKIINNLYKLTLKYQTMPILWIITLFPVLILLQLFLVLFGQSPDTMIRIFLDTSNFNYSQITPLPPITVASEGHYLCTVSLKGHSKVVKPVRRGIRGGEIILVNRQLLIANAFENILEEYTPRLHKLIRYIYDKYGYPLSKHINSNINADITYLLMKPLELFFLLVLYTVDINPENRINIQYSELRKN